MKSITIDPENYFDKIIFGRIGICWNTYIYDEIVFKGWSEYGSNWSRWRRKFLGVYWRSAP